MKQIVKKLVVFLLTALLLSALNMGAWSVLADQLEEGPLTYEVKDGAVTIISADAALKGKLEIPATIEDYPVTAIAKKAFYGCRKITSVVIPASVQTIGLDAFGHCAVLNRIDVDSDNESFCDVDGVLYNKDKTILIRFPNMYGVSVYTIPEGVTAVESRAFFGCSGLRTVEFPDSVTTIGTNAFHFTSVEEIVLPPRLTVVEFGLFSGSASLKKVELPDGITSIGASAFGGCKKLTSINIPDGVLSIGKECFADCSSLTGITLPDSVTTLGARAFFFCSELKTADLGNSVTILGAETFAGCRKLKSVSLPDALAAIGEQAFQYCQALTEVTLPARTTLIETGAFSGCESLSKIVIPEGVLTVKSGTFHNCLKLAEVTLPATVKTVEHGAFSGCEVLKDVYYGGSARDKSKIDIADENGELNSAQWHYAVEEEVQTAVKKETEEEFVMPPWMKTALYVGVLVVAVVVLILIFRNTSED